MTVDEARKIILDQEGSVEGEHHGHPDFRVNDKIFATLRTGELRSVLRLPMEFAESKAQEDDQLSNLSCGLEEWDGLAWNCLSGRRMNFALWRNWQEAV